METSSDDSFAWAIISNASDNSTDSETNIPFKNEDVKSENGLKGVNGNSSVVLSTDKKAKKKKRKKESTSDEDSIGSPRIKKIKIEPSSDNDVKNTKSKKKMKDDTCDSEQYLHEHDESFLNMKVKEEIDSLEKHKNKKKKKKNRDIDNDVSINSTYEFESEVNNEIYVEKKRKKKKRKSDFETDSLMSDEQKFADRPRKGKHKSYIDKPTDSSYDNFTEDTAEEALEVGSKKSNGNEPFENGIGSTDIECTEDNSVKNINSYDESIKTTVSEHFQNGIEKKHKVTSNNNIDMSLHQNKQKKPKILDKIQFQDDINSDVELPQKNKEAHSSNMKSFLKVNPGLQQCSENIENMSEITNDDEIWIVKCPHDIDVVNFSNRDLSLDGKCKIKINGETYCGTLDEERRRITIMSNDENKYTIKNIDINGVIRFRKRLPKQHFVEDNMMANNQTDFIPLPEIKCRHPLFGSNYKNAIKIPTLLTQRLNASNDTNITVNSDTKKRKNHKTKHSYPERDEEIVERKPPKKEVMEDAPVKKAKKRKHNNSDEHIHKKAKKVKKETDSSAVWESEKAIEENLFNF